MHTEAQAKARMCPFVMHTDVIPDVVTTTRPTLCVASECMAWRWSEKTPKEPARKIWWPETEDEAVLRGPGPERPRDAEGAAWVPLNGSEAEENWEGGYWKEPAEEHRRRIDEIAASRHGFCGAACAPNSGAA